jgi:hypothetical protein
MTPKFAVQNGNGKGVQILEGVKPTDTNLHLFPFKDPFRNLDRNIILLPTGVEEYGSEDNLKADMFGFIGKYAYMYPFYHKTSTYYSLLSWAHDAFGAVPYLAFLGDKDSGKTRMGETVANICYSTVMLSGASTIAPMFRLIDRYRGTLFMDEVDYEKSEMTSEWIKMMNVGYKPTGVIWRMDKHLGDMEPKAYMVYGPKIITHRKRFGDDATESRCITYEVPKVFDLPSHIPSQIIPGPNSKFTQEAISIRNKCLKWRIDNIRNIVPNLAIADKISNRYREIAISILTIVGDSDKEYTEELIDKFSVHAKAAKDESFSSITVRAIKSLYNKEKGLDDTIEINHIAVAMNKMLDDETPMLSNKKVGALCTGLGLQTKTGGKNGRARLIPCGKNEDQLKALFKEYATLEEAE